MRQMLSTVNNSLASIMSNCANSKHTHQFTQDHITDHITRSNYSMSLI